MLSNYEINLQLAQDVLKQIKAEVTSSHDIISRLELPYVHASQIASLHKRFPERFPINVDHLLFGEEIRNSNRRKEVIAYLKQKNIHDNINVTFYQAICMMGIGECADTSNFALGLLIEKKCKADVNVITLSGMKTIIIDGKLDTKEEFFHSLVIIGNCDRLGPMASLKDFSKLSDDCILLDPFLGVIGQAKKIQTLDTLSEYLKIFKVTGVMDKLSVDPFQPGVAELSARIKQNAIEISNKWKEELGTYQNRNQIAWEKKILSSEKLLSLRTMLLPLGINQPAGIYSVFNDSSIDDIKAELQRICGDKYLWKFNKQAQKAFLIGEKTDLDTIRNHLLHYDIHSAPGTKVKDSDDYCLIITAKNLEKIKEVPGLNCEYAQVLQKI